MERLRTVSSRWHIEITQLEGYKVIKSTQLSQRRRCLPVQTESLKLKDGDIFYIPCPRSNWHNCWVWTSEAKAPHCQWTKASNYFPHPEDGSLFLCIVCLPMWTTKDVINKTLNTFIPPEPLQGPHEASCVTACGAGNTFVRSIQWAGTTDMRYKPQRHDVMFGTDTHDIHHHLSIHGAPPYGIYIHTYGDNQRSFWLNGGTDASPWTRVEAGTPHPLCNGTVLYTGGRTPMWIRENSPQHDLQQCKKRQLSSTPTGTEECVQADEPHKYNLPDNLAEPNVASQALTAWQSLDHGLATHPGGKHILQTLARQNPSTLQWNQLTTSHSFGRTPSLEHMTQSICSAYEMLFPTRRSPALLSDIEFDNIDSVWACPITHSLNGVRFPLLPDASLPSSFAIPSTSTIFKTHFHNAEETTTIPDYQGTLYLAGTLRFEQGSVIRHEIVMCITGSLLVFGWPMHPVNRNAWHGMCLRTSDKTLYGDNFVKAMNSMKDVHVNLVPSGESVLIPIGHLYSVIALQTSFSITASFIQPEDSPLVASLTAWINRLPQHAFLRSGHPTTYKSTPKISPCNTTLMIETYTR